VCAKEKKSGKLRRENCTNKALLERGVHIFMDHQHTTPFGLDFSLFEQCRGPKDRIVVVVEGNILQACMLPQANHTRLLRALLHDIHLRTTGARGSPPRQQQYGPLDLGIARIN
jgi:hypothetical protein